MERRQNILSKTNNCQSLIINCQLKCPVRDRMLVEKETNSRHYDESQNPLNYEIAGLTRNDELLRQLNLTGFKNLLGLQA
ncbi:MAG: hypothetical protein LBJ63_09045 [Prevotellaceae bacterium]|nr:hypothetical protein [Prevotellaceae bacterium]